MPMYFSKNFTVSILTFRSLNSFDFIFVYDMRECSDVIVLLILVQFAQDHLWVIFIHDIFLPPLA